MCNLFAIPHHSTYVVIVRVHRIGQTPPVFVKRFVMKDSVEESILSSRRSLAANRPPTLTPLDGTGLIEEEQNILGVSKKKRSRHEDENDLDEQRFQRLELLEDIFRYLAAEPTGKKS